MSESGERIARIECDLRQPRMTAVKKKELETELDKVIAEEIFKFRRANLDILPTELNRDLLIKHCQAKWLPLTAENLGEAADFLRSRGVLALAPKYSSADARAIAADLTADEYAARISSDPDLAAAIDRAV